MGLKKILPLETVFEVAEELKPRGRRVVFTNGCFDVLHPGHLRCLAEARKLGDILIVAINSDRSVRALKGPGRPIFPEGERAEILAALECVDYVTIFNEDTPLAIIERLAATLRSALVLVKGANWGPTEVVGRGAVEKNSGRVERIPVVPGFSTSSLLEAALKNLG